MKKDIQRMYSCIKEYYANVKCFVFSFNHPQGNVVSSEKLFSNEKSEMKKMIKFLALYYP